MDCRRHPWLVYRRRSFRGGVSPGNSFWAAWNKWLTDDWLGHVNSSLHIQSLLSVTDHHLLTTKLSLAAVTAGPGLSPLITNSSPPCFLVPGIIVVRNTNFIFTAQSHQRGPTTPRVSAAPASRSILWLSDSRDSDSTGSPYHISQLVHMEVWAEHRQGSLALDCRLPLKKIFDQNGKGPRTILNQISKSRFENGLKLHSAWPFPFKPHALNEKWLLRVVHQCIISNLYLFLDSICAILSDILHYVTFVLQGLVSEFIMWTTGWENCFDLSCSNGQDFFKLNAAAHAIN